MPIFTCVLLCVAPAGGEAPGFSNRNKQLSAIYSPLVKNEKEIFRSPTFEALAGVAFYDTTTDSDEILEPKVPTLTDEQEALYRPIWDRLVDKDKILTVLGPNAKVPTTEAQVKLAEIEFRKVKNIVGRLVACLGYVEDQN